MESFFDVFSPSCIIVPVSSWQKPTWTKNKKSIVQYPDEYKYKTMINSVLEKLIQQ